MKKSSESAANEPESARECLPGFLTVKEAARIIGVSTRTIYGYVHTGKLAGARIGHTILVNAEHARAYKSRVPGRLRARSPRWHQPPPQNLQYLTTIRLRVRSGQDEAFEHKLHEIRTTRKHLLPGTVARYIAHDPHEPTKITIMLVWRRAIMPSAEERAAALSALSADLADVLAWETAARTESRVLLHA